MALIINIKVTVIAMVVLYSGCLKTKNRIDFRSTGNGASIGTYKNGLKDGLWIDLYPNGAVTDSIYYSKGKRNGVCKTFYIDGTLLYVGRWRMDTPIGEQIHYYANGNINYIDRKDSLGQSDGKFELFYETGVLKQVGMKCKNRDTGDWKLFDTQGKLVELKYK